MDKNNITAQNGDQYHVKGVKPEELPKKTPYELITGTKDVSNKKDSNL
jgi:hypothetical protein